MTESADFQARATKEGRQTQEIAGQVITGAGFEIAARNKRLPDCGLTANYIATDKEGEEWIFDTSGSYTSKTPGLSRTDTMWKTLGRMNVLHCLGYVRVLLLTTNLPPKGTVGDRALRAAAATFFDAVEMIPREGKLRLAHYAKGGKALLPLPGYRAAGDIYESQPTLFGATMSLPVDAVARQIPFTATKVVELPHRIEVTVPSLDQAGQPLQTAVRDDARGRIREMLGKVAGGCTAQEATGSWIHPIDGEIQEGVSVIASYSSEPFSEHFIEEVVNLLLGDLRQHTAAVTINDRMYQFESQTDTS